MSYSIYHIPGIKIGCTDNIERRVVKSQGYTEYQILEEHTDIYKASIRELQLQREYGYPVDVTPYHIFVNGKTQQKGGTIGGKISGKITTSRPEWKQTASKGGTIGGKIRAKNITFEELSYAGKKNRNFKDYEVKWMRAQYQTGKYTMKQIRNIFGINHSAMSNIINYKTYKEI